MLRRCVILLRDITNHLYKTHDAVHLFYNNRWVLLLAERFCYRVALPLSLLQERQTTWERSRGGRRKGTPLHVGLWKAVTCETGKNGEGIWWKPQSSGWARPCPSRPRTLETEDAAAGNAALNLEQIEENLGIYSKGGYARGRYILIQTMDSKRFYVEKNENGCQSSLALTLRFSALIPKRPQHWGPLVCPKWASVGHTDSREHSKLNSHPHETYLLDSFFPPMSKRAVEQRAAAHGQVWGFQVLKQAEPSWLRSVVTVGFSVQTVIGSPLTFWNSSLLSSQAPRAEHFFFYKVL